MGREDMGQLKFESKMKILNAAKKLFARKGFEKTGLRDICKEAGLNSVMVHHHFHRKENLLSAIFQNCIPLYSNSWCEEGCLNPVPRILQIIREVLSLGINDPEIIAILQQVVVLPFNRNELLQFLILPLWKEFRELLILGKANGLFLYDSIDVTLAFVISSVLMYRQWDFFGDILQSPTSNRELIIDEISTLILNALNYKDHNQISLV
jgi:AcrR family transcriptional regulator